MTFFIDDWIDELHYDCNHMIYFEKIEYSVKI